MLSFNDAVSLFALCSTLASAIPAPGHTVHGPSPTVQKRSGTHYNGPVITPKAFIISLFSYETAVWHTAHYGLLAQNITIPGLSPVYPVMNCNANGSLCQLTTGEAGNYECNNVVESELTLLPHRNQCRSHHLCPYLIAILRSYQYILPRRGHCWRKSCLQYYRWRRTRPLRRTSRPRI